MVLSSIAVVELDLQYFIKQVWFSQLDFCYFLATKLLGKTQETQICLPRDLFLSNKGNRQFSSIEES